MGHDYSYSQPSTSEEDDMDITSLLQAEAGIYADEAESSHNIVEPFEYNPQPEADEGFPKTCYCGDETVIATSHTRNDPGRRYYTCENAHDGNCHVWKWWDVAVMEEISDFQRQLRHVKDQHNESEQKVAKLEEIVLELAKKKAGVRDSFPLVVYVMVSICFLICMVIMFKWVDEKANTITECLEELQRLKRLGSDL